MQLPRFPLPIQSQLHLFKRAFPLPSHAGLLQDQEPFSVIWTPLQDFPQSWVLPLLQRCVPSPGLSNTQRFPFLVFVLPSLLPSQQVHLKRRCGEDGVRLFQEAHSDAKGCSRNKMQQRIFQFSKRGKKNLPWWRYQMPRGGMEFPSLGVFTVAQTEPCAAWCSSRQALGAGGASSEQGFGPDDHPRCLPTWITLRFCNGP